MSRAARCFVVSIPGEPIAKERPRLGRGGTTRTPKKTADAEKDIGWYVRQAIGSGTPPIDGPVQLTAIFWTHSQVKDLDNLIKTVMDGCNGVAWVDDRQVQSLWARVHRNPEVMPYTEFSVEALSEPLHD